ncbi:hypothetical protein D2E76_16015 [Mycobacteroides abscessus]|uniref:Uncharacterized protein n=1 Tax=Mycobacteroides abscessus TaxID=36809 RepID=A0ABD7HM57_9MYCO|nr:hypothetical protein D2E76_16015 [Mycobacteroides abscessus]
MKVLDRYGYLRLASLQHLPQTDDVQSGRLAPVVRQEVPELPCADSVGRAQVHVEFQQEERGLVAAGAR